MKRPKHTANNDTPTCKERSSLMFATTPERFHPGEYLKDEMEERDWSIETMMERSQLRRYVIEEIIAGTRRVTPLTARCLSNAFGTGSQIWVNLQKSFDGE